MNWKQTQRNLGVTPDGIPGPITYQAIFDYVAGRKTDSVLGITAAKYFTSYGMTTPQRIAEFVAQCANETGGFVRWNENLNYSVAGMLKTWPDHFTPALANWAKGNPQRVAEVAYGVLSKKGVGRMGNVLAGDGWTYRGRGALQLTGKANYKRFGEILGLDLVKNPDLAASPGISLLIALEFFKQGNVNRYVDAGNYTKARQITNGGSIGLEEVRNKRNSLLKVLV